MQSKTFSQLSLLVVVLATGLVMIALTRKAASTVPLPEFVVATSTSISDVPTPVMEDPDFLVSSATSTAVSDPSVVFVHTSKTEVPAATSTPAPVAPVPQLVTIPLKAPLGTIKAIVANTPASREMGLSDRASMATDTGMLFEFDTPEKYGFWMKDMKFPLDFIWILPNKTVTGIRHDVLPSSYPRVYYSRQFVSYVLELNAGGAAKWGIATGTQLVF